MLRWPKIYQLSIWKSKTGRIKRKYFLKNEIYLGTDKKADLCLGSLGFHARLNFEESEFEDFSKNGLESCPAGSLVTWEDLVFSWSLWSPPKLALLPFILILGFLLSYLMLPSFRSCSQNMPLPPAISELLAKGDLIQVRSKILEWESKLMEQKMEPHCYESDLMQLETAFTEAFVLKKLEGQQAVSAAEVYKKYRERFKNSHLPVLESKIISSAKRLYWSSWRLERQDPGRSYELAKQAAEICAYVGKTQACFEDTSNKLPN